MSQEDWSRPFLAWARRAGHSKRTLKNYDRYSRLLAEYLAARGIEDPCQADRATVAEFTTHVATHESARGRPYSTSTRGHIVSWLRKLYAYLVTEQRILMDPTRGLRPPRMGRRLPRAILTSREMERLLRAPDVKALSGLRDRAILELVYGAGLRFSEVVDLSVGDVDLVERTLWVRQGKGNRDRVLPLGRWAAYWLGRYLEASDADRRRRGTERVFLASRAKRLSNEMINMSLRWYAAKVGITKPISLHSLRHTFATVLLKGGADIRKIQRLLGHSRLTTTEIYTHVDLTDLRRVQERCHPRERQRTSGRGRIRGE